MNPYSTAEDRVRVMSVLRLEWIIADAPKRREMWTPLERAAEAEYDERIIAKERAA